jgi:hypothetical protein
MSLDTFGVGSGSKRTEATKLAPNAVSILPETHAQINTFGC